MIAIAVFSLSLWLLFPLSLSLSLIYTILAQKASTYFWILRAVVLSTRPLAACVDPDSLCKILFVICRAVVLNSSRDATLPESKYGLRYALTS